MLQRSLLYWLRLCQTCLTAAPSCFLLLSQVLTPYKPLAPQIASQCLLLETPTCNSGLTSGKFGFRHGHAQECRGSKMYSGPVFYLSVQLCSCPYVSSFRKGSLMAGRWQQGSSGVAFQFHSQQKEAGIFIYPSIPRSPEVHSN